MSTAAARCGDSPCSSCDDGGAPDPCHYCDGTGRWCPERPRRDAGGVIGWVRVDEDCRMCGGTGREHHPVP